MPNFGHIDMERIKALINKIILLTIRSVTIILLSNLTAST